MSNPQLTMDISSSKLIFGQSCPGMLMQQLMEKDTNNASKIRQLQTGYSWWQSEWVCEMGCRYPRIVAKFIAFINATQSLSIANFEKDMSLIWSAILQSKNLTRLSIYTPPFYASEHLSINVWTPEAVRDVADELQQLVELEMGVTLKDAESALAVTNGVDEGETALTEVVKIPHLESLLVHINLPDAESSFADEYKYNAGGSINDPAPKKGPCVELARHIFEQFIENDRDSALESVVVRFARVEYEERYQHRPVAYGSFYASMGSDGDVCVRQGERTGSFLDDCSEVTWRLYDRLQKVQREADLAGQAAQL